MRLLEPLATYAHRKVLIPYLNKVCKIILGIINQITKMKNLTKNSTKNTSVYLAGFNLLNTPKIEFPLFQIFGATVANVFTRLSATRMRSQMMPCCCCC